MRSCFHIVIFNKGTLLFVSELKFCLVIKESIAWTNIVFFGSGGYSNIQNMVIIFPAYNTSLRFVIFDSYFSRQPGCRYSGANHKPKVALRFIYIGKHV